MKAIKYSLTIILLCFTQFGRAQHFEIPIYFEDSSGQSDSLVLGYDELASYGIDSAFGEIDLIDSAYTNDFEVRAAIYDYGANWHELPRIIESKKMIVSNVCSFPSSTGEENAIMVVIKSQYWPVTIRWDNSLFQEECNFIDIVDCTPGGWFDVCGGGHPHTLFEMRLADSVSYYDTEFKIDTEQDTLSALFFRFYKDLDSGVKDEYEMANILFPNPTTGLISLDYELAADDNIRITDIFGRSIPFTFNNQQIDLSFAQDGLYLLTLKLQTGVSIVKKIIKKSS